MRKGIRKSLSSGEIRRYFGRTAAGGLSVREVQHWVPSSVERLRLCEANRRPAGTGQAHHRRLRRFDHDAAGPVGGVEPQEWRSRIRRCRLACLRGRGRRQYAYFRAFGLVSRRHTFSRAQGVFAVAFAVSLSGVLLGVVGFALQDTGALLERRHHLFLSGVAVRRGLAGRGALLLADPSHPADGRPSRHLRGRRSRRATLDRLAHHPRVRSLGLRR